jgi:hypothetical protein
VGGKQELGGSTFAAGHFLLSCSFVAMHHECLYYTGQSSTLYLLAMATTLWAQQAVEGFFRRRKYPTQFECNRIAQNVSGASNVHNVDTPGSMSYTVVCTGRRAGDGKDLVISFREPEAHLDKSIEEMAQAIHGDLVPATSRYGVIDGADPPLTIYTMPYLKGISCLDALACQVEMDEASVARHVCFVRHLAR